MKPSNECGRMCITVNFQCLETLKVGNNGLESRKTRGVSLVEKCTRFL